MQSYAEVLRKARLYFVIVPCSDTIGANARQLPVATCDAFRRSGAVDVLRCWPSPANIMNGKGLCASDATKKLARSSDLSFPGPVGNRSPVPRDGERSAGA